MKGHLSLSLSFSVKYMAASGQKKKGRASKNQILCGSAYQVKYHSNKCYVSREHMKTHSFINTGVGDGRSKVALGNRVDKELAERDRPNWIFKTRQTPRSLADKPCFDVEYY
jgi:hypothetical protein